MKAIEDRWHDPCYVNHAIHEHYELRLEVLDMIPELGSLIQSEDLKRCKWLLHNYPWTLGEENCEMLKRLQRVVEVLHGEYEKI